MIEQLALNLERAQATYRNVLRTIDGQLRALVSRDPVYLADARALQATYPVLHDAETFGVEPAVSADADTAPLGEMSASEALFAFMGWLTSRPQRQTFSAVDDASPAVELIGMFIEHHRLTAPREDWTSRVNGHPVEVITDRAVIEEALRETTDAAGAELAGGASPSPEGQ